MTGLYIHVPFCASKCKYCDFYSLVSKGYIDSYVDEVVAEIKKNAIKHSNKTIDTIYFGGGTPSILTYNQLKTITDSIYDNFATDIKEFSIEVNPDLSQDVPRYKDLGITRISVGVQSTNEQILSNIGRKHSAITALNTLKKAQDCGFDVSADIMIGCESSTSEDVIKTLYDVSPYCTHVSAYILKVEEKTPLKIKVDKGEIILPDDDEVADTYMQFVEMAEKLGFKQYEISNFAKENKESIHNLKYWKQEEYIGVGPSAHSYIDGIRYYNTPNIKEYLNGENSANGKIIIEEDDIICGVSEYLMLGLRLVEGVSIEEIKQKFNVDILEKYREKFDKLKNFFEITSDHIAIKKEFFLIQNSILTSLLF